MCGLQSYSLLQILSRFHLPIDRTRTSSIIFLNFPLHGSSLPAHFSLRFKNNVRLLLKQSLHPVYASNGSSEGSDVTRSSEAAKGPPFLTIFAGLLVFLALPFALLPHSRLQGRTTEDALISQLEFATQVDRALLTKEGDINHPEYADEINELSLKGQY